MVNEKKCELIEITPDAMQSGIGSCPSIIRYKDKYFVIGRLLESEKIEKLELGKKVGKGESVVEISIDLIDDIIR